MSYNYRVVQASQHDVGKMIQWAKQAGWNPGLEDANCFYAADPNGFFLGKLEDKVVAMGAAVIYDPNFAFCGLYMVDKNHQHHGYGLTLTKRRLAYVGNRCVGLDGVLNMENVYARLGYQTDFISSLYRTQALFPPIPCSHILLFSDLYFQAICDYDVHCFPAKRDVFLKYWLNHPTLMYVKDQHIMGYGVIRPCFEGYKIGPLFADNEEIADILLSHLLTYAKGQPVMLAIPEYQQMLKAWIIKYQMKKVFSVARMYRGNPLKMDLNRVYAITSYELG